MIESMNWWDLDNFFAEIIPDLKKLDSKWMKELLLLSGSFAIMFGVSYS